MKLFVIQNIIYICVTIEAVMKVGDNDAPKDRYKLMSLIFLLQGFAMQITWNMFINAHSYFVEYKLGFNYTQKDMKYNIYFLQYITFASQLPDIVFAYMNCFVPLCGTLNARILISLFMVLVIYHMHIILALVDTSNCPGFFFWSTMVSIAILKTFNAIYYNCMLGIPSMFPPKYMQITVIGCNACGIFTSLVEIISFMTSGDLKVAAIYYFITATFVIYAALDSYYALPLIKYYRHHKQRNKASVAEHPKRRYGYIIKKIWVQLYNISFNFIVSYSCFPAIAANVAPSSENFFIPKQYYARFMAFLTFNVFTLVGALLAALYIFPKPKYIWIVITIRVLFLPFFLLCNYRPVGKRSMMVFFDNDYVFFVVTVLLALTNGYYWAGCMQAIPRLVEPEFSRVAGMMGGVADTSGVFIAVMISFIWPSIVM